ncbi:transglycosylase isoform X3 [Wolffia australiana]
MSFKYWEDCVDPEDLEALWAETDVEKEWTDAGENMGKKVHLSRDPDGQPFLTQTEMKAVAGIIEMICAIAEIGSDRRLLALQYDKKAKENKLGIMLMTQKKAEWLSREMGYQSYQSTDNPEILYRPFTNVYFGAAYLKILSNFDGMKRSEEFIVRAYRGGTKKATHKSTNDFFQRYLLAKQTLPSWEKHISGIPFSRREGVESAEPNTFQSEIGDGWTYWDSRVSPDDMEELWKSPEVLKDWTKSGERRGRVRFSLDSEKRPYLSRAEVKAVAEIIISRYFSREGIQASVLAALAEMCSMRFVNGVDACTGLMGIDYQTALWLYNDLGYKGYKVRSVEDLYNPFTSIYFGASYLAWLSTNEGRERTEQSVVEAFLRGPENVNGQENDPIWNKFLSTLSHYQDIRRVPGGCNIL